MSQSQRDAVMQSFRKQKLQLLVATDVAARGIDVEDITHVINYQLPDEVEVYTHRSGRTGRAGKLGISVMLVTKSDLRKLKSIEN
ncbi:MAG: C-terminal helicase domain-containing protein, partial [Flavobacteriaceae bacterium]